MGYPAFLYNSAKSRGISSSIYLAEDFLDGDPSALILGDNIFFGHGLVEVLAIAN